ncbi:MAG: hypothetical protein EHM33_04835 [Chloroflexi bacterium]|nr:MAG: hypothetical protein EHM33_04835 [Chloroflexota bacterium]
MLFPPSLVIGLYIYIGSFNRMLGDDYCTMYQGQHLGLFRSIWFWYLTWHGRFSANVADWLISVAGPGGYPFYTFIFLATWAVFAVIAVKEALHFRGHLSFDLFAALLPAVFLVFTTLSLTPDIIESLFWWGGVRSYLSPLILVLLFFAFYYHFITSSPTRNQTALWLAISFGLAFFMGGFSETFTPVLVMLLAGLIAITWWVSKSNRKAASTLFLSAGFLGALFSLLAMVLAPGNSIRRAHFPAPPGIFTILSVAFASYLDFLSDIFSTPYMWTGLLGSTLGAVWLGMRINRGSGIAPLPGWQIVAVLCAGFVLAFSCFPTAVYATSEPPPARTFIIPAFILVVCFLVSGFILGEWLTNRVKSGFSLPATLLFVTAGSLIIFSSWSVSQRLYSMREEHISFARQWDQIDAEIREAKNSGLQQVNIPAMKNWADAEYPTDNPRYWPNICYSKFYDINISAPPLQP